MFEELKNEIYLNMIKETFETQDSQNVKVENLCQIVDSINSYFYEKPTFLKKFYNWCETNYGKIIYFMLEIIIVKIYNALISFDIIQA